MFMFGAGFVLTQFGLRWMQPWLGVAISIPTSTLLFWCLAPIFVDPSVSDVRAVVLFACVGLLFPGAAALLNFESNRLMGPNIAGALSSMTPVLAVLLAVTILGEHIRSAQLLGLAAIVVGISLMYRVHVNLSGRSLWLMALPVASAAIRGVVQPIVKIGFVCWPNRSPRSSSAIRSPRQCSSPRRSCAAMGQSPTSIIAGRSGLRWSDYATVWPSWRCTRPSSMGRLCSCHRSLPATRW